MIDQHPAPLTPVGCDLQDFPFMPLHVARLRDSDLVGEESPEACWYAVLLWAASWHQIPAGSLPDNDAVLTKLIGLGRDVRTFRKHRAGAMRGFVLCSDGRLYHEVVAEQVLAAWESKLRKRWMTECARIKKANQRTGGDQPQPSFEEFVASLPPGQRLQNVAGDDNECPEGQQRSSPGTAPPCPSGNGLQGIKTGTGTGTDSSEDKSSGGLAAAPEPDLDKAAWDSAVHVLTTQGGMTDKAARAFFGKLLSANSLRAKELLPATADAKVTATLDPQGYLTRIAQGIGRRQRARQAPKVVGFV